MNKFLLILSIAAASLMLSPSLMSANTVNAEIAVKHDVSDAHACPSGIILEVSHDADAPVRFMIYSITGQMVKSIDAAPGEQVTAELPAGYYIVKTTQWSKRLVVK